MEIRFFKQRPKGFIAAIEILYSFVGYECSEKCVYQLLKVLCRIYILRAKLKTHLKRLCSLAYRTLHQ